MRVIGVDVEHEQALIAVLRTAALHRIGFARLYNARDGEHVARYATIDEIARELALCVKAISERVSTRGMEGDARTSIVRGIRP